MRARAATTGDAEAMCRIYNEGIADRLATFESTPRLVDDVRAWFTGSHPIVAVESDDETVIAFASTSAYRPRACYRGIAEFSVYVARHARGKGAGRIAMTALIDAARTAGFWKLVSRVFVGNHASRRLLKTVGFREVGTYQKHARLDGVWRDTVIVELVL